MRNNKRVFLHCYHKQEEILYITTFFHFSSINSLTSFSLINSLIVANSNPIHFASIINSIHSLSSSFKHTVVLFTLLPPPSYVLMTILKIYASCHYLSKVNHFLIYDISNSSKVIISSFFY